MTPLADPLNVGNPPGAGPLRAGGISIEQPSSNPGDLPSVMSPSAKAQSSALTIVRDLWGGTERLRAATTSYLPKAPGERTDDYNIRLERSVFFNAFRRTVEGLCGLVFRKDPVLGDDVPPQIVEDWENIDNAGTHGDVFLHDLMVDAEAAGHSLILVDYPKTPEGVRLTRADEQPLRPYWVPIKKDNVRSWRTDIRDGALVLTQLVLKECQYVPDGRFGMKEQERYRVFTDDGVDVRWELMAITADRKTVVVDEGSYPTQAEIPIAEVKTSGSKSLFESDPPLIDLAHLNIAHYQQWSDYATSIHKTCVPIFVATGLNMTGPNGETLDLVLGPNAAIVTSNPNASAMYVAHDGAALGSARMSLEDLKNEMGTLGLSMLAPQKRSAETAEAKRMDKATTDSALAVTARGLQDAAERAMGFHAAYYGLDDGGSIEVNRDFEGIMMDAPVMQAYGQLVAAGFPPMAVLKALQLGGRIGADEDLDALEMEWLMGQSAKADMAQQFNAPDPEVEAQNIERDDSGRMKRIGGNVNVERDENGKIIRLVRGA